MRGSSNFRLETRKYSIAFRVKKFGKDCPLSSVQSLSHVRLFAIPWTTARQASLSITNSWSLPKLISIESVMPSNHLILCHPLFLPSIFPSIRVSSNESALCTRWPKYWSFIFSISPSNEYLGLISFWLTCLISLQSKGLSRVFSGTRIWKHQFFGAQNSLRSNSHICTWLLEKPQLWLYRLCQQSDVSAFQYTVYVYHSFSSKEEQLLI